MIILFYTVFTKVLPLTNSSVSKFFNASYRSFTCSAINSTVEWNRFPYLFK